jgi:hypothetical protein
MNFEIVHISRGDITLKSGDKNVRVLGDALISSIPNEPSYVVYLNSLDGLNSASNSHLNRAEKQKIVSVIRKHFHERGSIVDFE